MSKNFSKGFTLVELAIVLVVIGILLGAVLKGQELITNAKLKRLYNQYREIYAAVYTYYDKYDRLPGDDDRADERWSIAPGGDGNGRIDGSGGTVSETAAFLNCSGGSGIEACYLWQHLRLAGIIPGATDDRTNVKHVYGGSIGIKNADLRRQGYRHWIVFQRVPNEIARIIDEKYDDGDATSGFIVTASGDYSDRYRKELCFRLD